MKHPNEVRCVLNGSRRIVTAHIQKRQPREFTNPRAEASVNSRLVRGYIAYINNGLVFVPGARRSQVS